MDKDFQVTITNLVCECKLLEQQLEKKDEVIEKAINKCCNTLDYINNTLLLNNIKVELTELLKIKGELDMILESFVEEVE